MGNATWDRVRVAAFAVAWGALAAVALVRAHAVWKIHGEVRRLSFVVDNIQTEQDQQAAQISQLGPKVDGLEVGSAHVDLVGFGVVALGYSRSRYVFDIKHEMSFYEALGQAKDGDSAGARALLERRMIAGKATLEEIGFLRDICKVQGDDQCVTLTQKAEVELLQRQQP